MDAKQGVYQTIRCMPLFALIPEERTISRRPQHLMNDVPLCIREALECHSLYAFNASWVEG